jgi:hypothetical protein
MRELTIKREIFSEIVEGFDALAAERKGNVGQRTGTMKGKLVLPEDFDAPLPDEMLGKARRLIENATDIYVSAADGLFASLLRGRFPKGCFPCERQFLSHIFNLYSAFASRPLKTESESPRTHSDLRQATDKNPKK